MIACAASSHAQKNAELPSAPVSHVAPTATLDLKFANAPFGQVAASVPARYGSVDIQQATAEPLALSLDDAISRGLNRNLQITLATETERAIQGQILGVFFNLLPNLRATAYSRAQEINLAAMGFKPQSLAGFGLNPATFPTIVKVNTTAAQLSADQVLFNLPDYYLYRAARKAADVVKMNTLNASGDVVQRVGTQYLAALADQAQIANEEALVRADEEQLRQATLSRDAGVGINLDVIRARVQLQSEQQALVRAQNAFAKDKIQLNRLIGLPADQELTLTDTVPFSTLNELPLDEAMKIAFQRRKDLLALQAELQVAHEARKAVKFERLPSVSVNGYYGVLGQTEGMYHGVFTAQGVLKIPIFEEARFRGETQVATAEEIALQHQISSLRVTIEQQIRSSMLDLEASTDLMKVARSNVALATQEVADTREQYTAGVADNLPVVQAEATLAAAESRWVASEFQFNVSKLNLARQTGVVESQYKQYLGL